MVMIILPAMTSIISPQTEEEGAMITRRTSLISGALAGLASLLLTARLNSGIPQSGQGYELQAIAAVVVGGTSLMGGRGSIGGTFVGALLINALLIIPAAAAINLSRNMRQLFWLTIGLTLFVGVGGQWLQWELDWGANVKLNISGTIVLLSVLGATPTPAAGQNPPTGSPPPTSPSNRYEPSLAYDAATARVVLFGGYAAGSGAGKAFSSIVLPGWVRTFAESTSLTKSP